LNVGAVVTAPVACADQSGTTLPLKHARPRLVIWLANCFRLGNSDPSGIARLNRAERYYREWKSQCGRADPTSPPCKSKRLHHFGTLFDVIIQIWSFASIGVVFVADIGTSQLYAIALRPAPGSDTLGTANCRLCGGCGVSRWCSGLPDLVSALEIMWSFSLWARRKT